jgi:hypothetical protein
MKLSTSPFVTPRKVPEAVITVGAAAGAAGSCAKDNVELKNTINNPRHVAFILIIIYKLYN